MTTACPPEASTSYRRFAPYAVLVLGGVVGAASWLDQRFFLGAWIGMFVLAYLTLGQGAPVAFRRAIVFGLTAMIAAFHWVPEVTSRAPALSYFTSTILFLFAVACEAFHFGLAAYLAARCATPRIWGSLLFPVCFIGLEMIWIRIFPWRIAQSQIPWTSFIQIAELVGVYGVGFVMLWTICALASWLKGRASRGELAACASVLTASLVFGVWRIRDVEARAEAQPPLRVALIQADVWQQDAAAKLQALSRSVAPDVELICWPESSAGRYHLELADFRSAERLRQLSRALPPLAPQRPLENPPCALLCVGESYDSDASDNGPYFTTAFLIDRQENIIGRYHKRTLLPLGEYMPGERWIPALAMLALTDESSAAGTSPAIMELPDGPSIGALICYEDMREANARTSVAAGAELLVTLLNGAAFGMTPAMRQHQQLAHFRAIENRRYFLRCATTGSTAVISPTGKLVAELPAHQDGVLTATVHPLNVATVYTRFGNWFGYLCLAAIGVLLLSRLAKQAPAHQN